MRALPPGSDHPERMMPVTSRLPATDQPRNATLMNLGTFVGAVAFLIGAVLLLPERTQGGDAPAAEPDAAVG